MIISLNLGIGHNPLPPVLIKLTGSDEVVLIELQGSLATTGDTPGQLVGTLSMDSPNDKPILRIGHHLLEGVIQTLPKPCAVIARTSSQHPSRLTDDEKYGTGLGFPNNLPGKLCDLKGRDPLSRTHLHGASQPDISDVDNQTPMDGDDDDELAGKAKRAGMNVDDNLELEPLDVELEQKPNEVSYDIVTIVRKKIVFAKRPIPIVPSSLKGLGSITVNTETAGVGGAGDRAAGAGGD